MAKRAKGKGPKNPLGMMGQLQQLQEQLANTQAALAEETVTATVGGGVVSVTMTGDQHCKAIEIDPSLLDEDDIEIVQDLILTAFNSALEKSRELATERLGPLTNGLPF
jgi:DNA-binding YbaB/EbfC family protein